MPKEYHSRERRVNLTFRTVYPDPRGTPRWHFCRVATEVRAVHLAAPPHVLEALPEAAPCTFMMWLFGNYGVCFSGPTPPESEPPALHAVNMSTTGTVTLRQISKSRVIIRQIKNCSGCAHRWFGPKALFLLPCPPLIWRNTNGLVPLGKIWTCLFLMTLAKWRYKYVSVTLEPSTGRQLLKPKQRWLLWTLLKSSLTP